MRSNSLVPMLRKNDLIGAISVYQQTVRPFTDRQIALLAGFANQAVIAIENARLLTELRARSEELGRSVGELRMLAEVSQAVNKTLDLETVLSTIAAKAVQLSNTDAGAIYVFDDAQRLFRLRATYGMDRKLIDALTHQRIGLDGVDVALPLTRGEIFQVADLREEPATPLNQIILAAGYRALLAAPLMRGADIVGVLVIRRRIPGLFTRNSVDLVNTLTMNVAVASYFVAFLVLASPPRDRLPARRKYRSLSVVSSTHISSGMRAVWRRSLWFGSPLPDSPSDIASPPWECYPS